MSINTATKPRMNSATTDYVSSVTSGVTAGLAVAPVMTTLDLAILRAQFSKESLGRAIQGTTRELFSGRAKWNPAFNIMWGVYASTYVTANTTRKICQRNGMDPVVPVAISTSVVNSVAIAMKDRKYAQLTGGSGKIFGASSLMLLGLRDGLTITSSFVLKGQVADWLVRDKGWDAKTAGIFTSFAVPMAAQPFSAPLHILAMDKFERPEASLASRLYRVRLNFLSVTSGRILRIVPAFGLGGFLNDLLKDKTEDMLERGPPLLQGSVGAEEGGKQLLRRTSDL